MPATAAPHEEPRISVRAYARRRGVSHTAVQRAIADGRLVRAVVRLGDGTAQILPALADHEWQRGTSPAHSRAGESPATTPAPSVPQRLVAPISAIAPLPARPDARAEPRLEARGGPDDYRRTLVVEKVVKTKLAQVRLDEQLGRLIDATEAGDAQFEIARLVRNQLQELPDRLAAELALESDAHRVREILAHEIDDVLRKLVARLRAFGASANAVGVVPVPARNSAQSTATPGTAASPRAPPTSTTTRAP